MKQSPFFEGVSLQTVRTTALSVLIFVLALELTGCSGAGSSQPGHPTSLSIAAGDHQSGTVGAPLPQLLMVKVGDQTGQPLANAGVNWSIQSGSGSLDHSSTVTGQDGTASVGWTLGTKAGGNSVNATISGLTPVSFVATGSPGPLASISVTSPQNPAEAGNPIQLGAAGADAFGNAVAFALPPTWISSDASVGAVNPDGFVFPLSPGNASISASTQGITGSLFLTVTAKITFVFGPEETVFRWTSDSCEPLDVPDVPAHAVRLADGTLMLADGDAPRNYAMFGADFSTLHKDCTAPALASDDNHSAESYDNQEWIHSVYREGNIIHALIHNEFHDPVAANCSPGNTSPGNPCWYNSIGYASSTDSGRTFTHAAAPSHVIAPPPVQWDPQGPPPPHGYFNPSSIVHAPDNFYYSIFMAIDRSGSQALCVMRTQTLGNPASWRAWDGVGYNLQMTSPYTGPAPAMCSLVGVDQTLGIWGSLTYNTYLGKYMLVGIFGLGNTNPPVCGMGYSLSPDLIQWTVVRLIRTAYLPSFPGCQAPNGATASAYPSIIDHGDTTVNFEMAGRTPYLYFTRFNDSGLNRDLVRVPLTITSQ